MQYKWLLFDTDNTLLDFDAAERVSLTEALAARNISVDETIQSVYHTINSAIWVQIERGEFDRENLNAVRFSRLAEHFGFELDAEETGRDFFAVMAKQRILIPGAEELCRDLAEAYSLHMITNGTAFIQHGRLDGLPMMDHFDGLFISQEVGAEKPSREFFDAVSAAIPNFSPKQALVIGDSLTSDIAGGIAAGIDTCWYNPKGKTAPAHCTPTYTVSDYGQLRRLLKI